MQKSLSHLCIHHTRGNQHSTFLPPAATELRALSWPKTPPPSSPLSCSCRGIDKEYFIEAAGPGQASGHICIISPHGIPPSLTRREEQASACVTPGPASTASLLLHQSSGSKLPQSLEMRQSCLPTEGLGIIRLRCRTTLISAAIVLHSRMFPPIRGSSVS